MKRKMNSKTKLLHAFTLAETLITLVIVGVVAALTVPVLFSHNDTRSNIIAFKKVYSELSQANNMLYLENGGDWTTLCNNFDDKCFRDLFAKKLRAMKVCDSALSDGCIVNSKFLNGSTYQDEIDVNSNYWPAIITSGGYSIKFRFHQNGCTIFEDGEHSTNTCGWVQIDTNGKRKPNTVGKDIFFLTFFPDKTIKPTGYQHDINDTEEDCKNGSGMYCGSVFIRQNN